MGKADVALDGVRDATIDLYSPTEVYEQVVYSNAGLELGNHTLTVTVRGDRNSASTGNLVTTDAFELPSDRIEGESTCRCAASAADQANAVVAINASDSPSQILGRAVGVTPSVRDNFPGHEPSARTGPPSRRLRAQHGRVRWRRPGPARSRLHIGAAHPDEIRPVHYNSWEAVEFDLDPFPDGLAPVARKCPRYAWRSASGRVGPVREASTTSRQ